MKEFQIDDKRGSSRRHDRHFRSFRTTAWTRAALARQCRRGAVPRQGRSRAATISVYRTRDGPADPRSPRAAPGSVEVAIRNGELSLYYQPQATSGPTASPTSEDDRLRGVGALACIRYAASGVTGRFHSAGGRKRPDRRNGRMDPARSLPRGGLLAGAVAGRGQSVAGAVHARRRGQVSCIRSCSKPGLAPGSARTRNHRRRADRGLSTAASRCCGGSRRSACGSRWTISVAAIPR